jgi:hypothetical protein
VASRQSPSLDSQPSIKTLAGKQLALSCKMTAPDSYQRSPVHQLVLEGNTNKSSRCSSMKKTLSGTGNTGFSTFSNPCLLFKCRYKAASEKSSDLEASILGLYRTYLAPSPSPADLPKSSLRDLPSFNWILTSSDLSRV